jgi:lysylphosphatidylglycerol synthetase-like protein (DUF2156 family)
MNWKNILSRAGWTFLQAGLAALPAALSVADVVDGSVWMAAGVAGLAAVFSLLKTIAVEQAALRAQ